MWSRRCPLRIALYQCEHLERHLPNSAPASWSSYASLLQAAIDHVASRLMPDSSVTLTSFDVMSQEYPAAVGRDFDGVLISGSLSSVYDNKPWVRRLLEEIRVLDKNQVKTCGISFGHQAIAAALGGTVAPNPQVGVRWIQRSQVDPCPMQGSEVCVSEAKLTPGGREIFNTRRRSFRLHYHHNDTIVKLPDSDELRVVAAGKITEFQALYKPHHLLTFCGHPDYSHQPGVLRLLLELDRRMGWVAEKVIREGIDHLDDPTDYEWIISMMLRFYSGLAFSDDEQQQNT